jgi:hypothetical protein
MIPDLAGLNKKNLQLQVFNGWMGLQRMQKKPRTHNFWANYFGKYGRLRKHPSLIFFIII